MRVLALVTDAFGGYGGIAQYNRDFLTALSQSKHVSEIVVLPRVGHCSTFELAPKVNQLSPVKSKAAYSLAAFTTAVRKKAPLDLLFCGHIYTAPLAAFLGKSLKAPVWLQTHGIDAWERPAKALRLAVERSALITTVSRYTRRRMLEWSNIDPFRVRVLPNTVRPIFLPGEDNAEVRAKYHLSRKKIILTVSRITKEDYYKGHSGVINALTAVRGYHPDLVYVIVGDGDGRIDLERQVSELGLQEFVRFVGRVSDEDVLALYQSASAFIMPSTKEGFGIVFAEAAATGLPVIGGSQDGSVDALADGRIGRVIDPRSQDQIVIALNDALAGRLGGNPLEVQRFAFQNFATHVDELVRNFSNY